MLHLLGSKPRLLQAFSKSGVSPIIQVRNVGSQPFLLKAKLRKEAQRIREHALGQHVWPAITVSRDDTIFAIQQKVFGYDRGGEGYIDFNKKLEPGKQPVPVKTGRKFREMAQVPLRVADWYPIDFYGKERHRMDRIFRQNPRHAMNEQLGVHQVKPVMTETFGPFMPYTTGLERALLRQRTERLISVKPIDLFTGMSSAERRTMELNKKRCADGKGKPKKGEGKKKTLKKK